MSNGLGVGRAARTRALGLAWEGVPGYAPIMRFISFMAAVVLSLGSAVRAEINQPADLIEITYTKYVLANGLTLMVHEDHKAPIVAVNVWYHVGSKNEKPGKTGFAHLFEHLMFNGSEHFDDDFFKAKRRLSSRRLGMRCSNGRGRKDSHNGIRQGLL